MRAIFHGVVGGLAGAILVIAGQVHGGERVATWIARNVLEPMVGNYDGPLELTVKNDSLGPYAMTELRAGNDEHVSAAELSNAGPGGAPVQITPAHDTLFTSGSLGQRSNTLNSVLEHRSTYLADKKEVMAD